MKCLSDKLDAATNRAQERAVELLDFARSLAHPSPLTTFTREGFEAREVEELVTCGYLQYHILSNVYSAV